MNLRYHRVDLQLRHTFTISRSSRAVAPIVIVEIEHEGIIGYGEAAPSERYGETTQTVTDFLKKVALSKFYDPLMLNDIICEVRDLAPNNTAAKAAVDIALHDWVGKKLRIPLWKLWGLNKDKTPLTSFTIGIDRLDIIEEKVKQAEPYKILKVKVGVSNDEEIIKTIRAVTDKTIRVDANEGWESKERARDKILWLEEQGVEFVEQPMPAHQLDDIAWVHDQVHIPLIADESVKNLDDIPTLKGVFDGINIKLMKCAGLREAMRMINTAKAMKMRVMLGCMLESSVAISAAAQLSPLVDYADLDGNLLITNDPFDGVNVREGRLILNETAGLGIINKTLLH
jgi:L-alanine-DL-glutamate epimerase-like enolase superfamily enzyme